MQESSFLEDLKKICRRDPRYDLEAYLFVRDALDFTAKSLKKPRQGPGRHVSGKELVEGIRDFALREYGPMALTVLKSWGISQTRDFGEIVFNLVEDGKLGRSSDDTKDDFADGYDFEEAFEQPFLPRRQDTPKKSRARRRQPPRDAGAQPNGGTDS